MNDNDIKKMERKLKKFFSQSDDEIALWHINNDLSCYGTVSKEMADSLFEKGIINRTTHYKVVRDYLIASGNADIDNIIIDDSYFKWIEDISKRRRGYVIYSPGFGYKMNDYDYKKFKYIHSLANLLLKYVLDNSKLSTLNLSIFDSVSLQVLYNDKIYTFQHDEEVGFVVCCSDYSSYSENTIVYEDFKEYCKKHKEQNENKRAVRKLYNKNKKINDL